MKKLKDFYNKIQIQTISKKKEQKPNRETRNSTDIETLDQNSI